MKKWLAMIMTAVTLCTFALPCFALDTVQSAPVVYSTAFHSEGDSVQTQTTDLAPDGNTNSNVLTAAQSQRKANVFFSLIKAVKAFINKVIQLFTHKEKDDYTFTFTVYGYGHGVGMSQLGAIEYAHQGWSYDRILLHYYSGVALEKETPPARITYGGKKWDTEEFLACAVQTELGNIDSGENIEAYKAQAVAMYSILKRNHYSISAVQFGCSSKEKGKLSSDVCEAVRNVLGQYLTYDGEAIFASFFASSAGKTTDCQSVWGMNIPYLTGGVDSLETVAVSSSIITVKGLQTLVQNYNKRHTDNTITLSGDPSQWIEIISHDGARGDVGYVTSIRLGDMTMSGDTFRTIYNIYKPGGAAYLDSHCFCINKLCFEWPVNDAGSYISAPFGYRTDPITGGTKLHGGIDIAAPSGTQVLASEAGEVTCVKNNNTGYGNYIIIKHDDMYATLYAHCSWLYVKVGDKVEKGQHIADVGQTGYATGTHLHFEVRSNGEKVDPMEYITKP